MKDKDIYLLPMPTRIEADPVLVEWARADCLALALSPCKWRLRCQEEDIFEIA